MTTASYSKDTQGWIIKIHSDTFDKRSIAKMHKLLDDGIADIVETKKMIKRVTKVLYEENN